MSHKIDLTLDRIRVLASHLPAYTRPTFHIAGTNGKGSVTALLSSILSASGLSVGRFNSPHLVSIYDCITLNGQPVSPDSYKVSRDEVEHVNSVNNIGASSFELLTLTALRIFEVANVDAAVIEVGMGGRLDATNIIPDDCILVSALTAVDLDHQAFLGSRVVDIAREKAGIARYSKPFVIGPQQHAEVYVVVRDVVAELRGTVLEARPSVRMGTNPHAGFSPISPLHASSFTGPPLQAVFITVPSLDQVPIQALLPLYGEHQLDNLGLVAGILTALLSHPGYSDLSLCSRISKASVIYGIRTSKWPGRLSFHVIDLPDGGQSDRPASPKKLIVLADGAHNPASASTLSTYISDLLSASDPSHDGRSVSLTFLLALSHSPPKTPAQTLSALLPPLIHPYLQRKLRVAPLRFTLPEGMPWVQSVSPEEIGTVVKGLVPSAEIWQPRFDKDAVAIGDALEWAADEFEKDSRDVEQLVVVAGSLYLVADFYRFVRSCGHDI